MVSTPIGNLDDVSHRALAVLRAADLVLCEDTRVTARMLAVFGITAPTAALHEHNEASRIEPVLTMLRAGKRVVLVSDAGTPLISDPGYRLVRAAIAEMLPVGAIPGPNAAVTALVLSGLPPHPFLFLGFAPPRQAARRTHYAALRTLERAGLSATLIWHEAPHRLSAALADLVEAFGNRPAAVARELTKRFEEVRRDLLPVLVAHYAAHPARGEITLLLGPAPAEPAGQDEVDARLRVALSEHSVREAAVMVAVATGVPRRTVYARALAMTGAAHPSPNPVPQGEGACGRFSPSPCGRGRGGGGSR